MPKYSISIRKSVVLKLRITKKRNLEDDNVFVRLINKCRNRKLRRNSSYRKAIAFEREKEKSYIERLSNKLEIFFTILFIVAFTAFSVTAVSLRPNRPDF